MAIQGEASTIQDLHLALAAVLLIPTSSFFMSQHYGEFLSNNLVGLCLKC